MNKIIEKDNIDIETLIYDIRGKQVMLDSDLAQLYECSNGTKDVNKAVSRNIDRFPEDFYFRLTTEEYEDLKFQIGTSSLNSHGGVRKIPHVFTEQGVAMLATVLRTAIASQMSVNIMRAFSKMRKYISSNLIEQKYINKMVLKHDSEINLLKKSLDKIDEKRKVNEIYFEGQIYDAYSKIVDILKEAKEELIIIDAYADKNVLDIIKEIKVPTILIVKSRTLLKKIDLEKYNKQYNNLNIIKDDTFHDRYIIVDKCTLYHCGTSINYAGSKTFSINRIEDNMIIDLLLKNINNIKKNQ